MIVAQSPHKFRLRRGPKLGLIIRHLRGGVGGQGWLLVGNTIRNGGCATAGTRTGRGRFLDAVGASGVMTGSFSDDVRLHGDRTRGSVEFIAR